VSILVSINCVTYNQENYIADAIESFLAQKTNFEFEILIGEDCSTDNTREIVEKYVRDYPDKVKLITSDHNVGFKKNTERIFNHSEGKYIALCDGDDYWIDPFKLQKQVDYLEQHADCTMCFHAAKIINSEKVPLGTFVRPSKNNTKFTAGDIALGGGGFFPTASVVYPKAIMENPPDCYRQASVDDFPLGLILAGHGYAYYIDEVMSVYRTGVQGSWTSQLLNGKDVNAKKIANNKDDIKTLDAYNHYSNGEYHQDVDKGIRFREFYIAICERNLREIKKSKYKDIIRELGFKGKVKYYLLFCMPSLSSRLSRLYGHFVKVKYNLLKQ